MADEPRQRGQLPKAYLRIDPNIDQTYPELRGTFVGLLCAAARQPKRGFFKSEDQARAILGTTAYRRFVSRGDLHTNGSGVYVDGWEEWQEGDHTVGERMRRVRSRKRNDVTNE